MMRKILAALMVLFSASVLIADPPELKTLDYVLQSDTDLKCYQANVKTYRWTILNNTTKVDGTGYSPFMYWSQRSTASIIYTASCSWVTQTNCVFDAQFSSQQTSTNGTFIYGVGISSGGISVVRQGKFQILPDPYSYGNYALVGGGTINWSNMTYIGTDISGPYAAGSNVNFRTKGSAGQFYIDAPGGQTSQSYVAQSGTSQYSVVAGSAGSVTGSQSNDVNNGATAYGWGNHASQGYLTYSSNLDGTKVVGVVPSAAYASVANVASNVTSKVSASTNADAATYATTANSASNLAGYAEIMTNGFNTTRRLTQLGTNYLLSGEASAQTNQVWISNATNSINSQTAQVAIAATTANDITGIRSNTIDTALQPASTSGWVVASHAGFVDVTVTNGLAGVAYVDAATNSDDIVRQSKVNLFSSGKSNIFQDKIIVYDGAVASGAEHTTMQGANLSLGVGLMEITNITYDASNTKGNIQHGWNVNGGMTITNGYGNQQRGLLVGAGSQLEMGNVVGCEQAGRIGGVSSYAGLLNSVGVLQMFWLNNNQTSLINRATNSIGLGLVTMTNVAGAIGIGNVGISNVQNTIVVGDGNTSLSNGFIVATGFSSSNYVGNGNGLTNINAANVAGTLPQSTLPDNVWTNGGTNYNASGIYNTGTTNLDGYAYAEKGWVRSLMAGGVSWYASSNASAVNTNYYIFATTTPTQYFTRVYTSVTNNQYLGYSITTSRYTCVISPVTVQPCIGYNVGGPRAVSIHAEIYYTYDGTNLLGDYEAGDQAVPSATSNLMTFTVSFPTINSTNSSGFYIVRALKVGTQNGSPNVTLYGTTNNNSSHISIANPTMDSSLGVRGATNATLAGLNSAYDSSTRVLTLPNYVGYANTASNVLNKVSASTNADSATYATTANVASGLASYVSLTLTNITANGTGTFQNLILGNTTISTNVLACQNSPTQNMVLTFDGSSSTNLIATNAPVLQNLTVNSAGTFLSVLATSLTANGSITQNMANATNVFKGYVGINVTAPATNLEVGGGIICTNLLVNGTVSGTANIRPQSTVGVGTNDFSNSTLANNFGTLILDGHQHYLSLTNIIPTTAKACFGKLYLGYTTIASEEWAYIGSCSNVLDTNFASDRTHMQQITLETANAGQNIIMPIIFPVTNGACIYYFPPTGGTTYVSLNILGWM